jgi:hypothetical protein
MGHFYQQRSGWPQPEDGLAVMQIMVSGRA